VSDKLSWNEHFTRGKTTNEVGKNTVWHGQNYQFSLRNDFVRRFDGDTRKECFGSKPGQI
jgi:hypothetical protein